MVKTDHSDLEPTSDETIIKNSREVGDGGGKANLAKEARKEDISLIGRGSESNRSGWLES
jgi:hypothetical protein